MKNYMKILYWIADTFPFLTSLAPFRVIGFALFMVAWISGEVGGWLAWAILLLFIDFTITINRN